MPVPRRSNQTAGCRGLRIRSWTWDRRGQIFKLRSFDFSKTSCGEEEHGHSPEPGTASARSGLCP